MLIIILQNLAGTSPGPLSNTLAFLTAMITPALLISASGTLVLSTSTRLGRVIDRARLLEARLTELITADDKSTITKYSRRIEVVFELLDKVTTRSRMLQKALFVFYCSVAIFVLTSLVIGLVGLLGQYVWIPIPIGLVGILFVFYGSILMMLESRMATETTNAEMDITWELATEIAPPDIVAKYNYDQFGKHRLRSRKAGFRKKSS